MIQITPDTSVRELLKEYPFLADFLASYNPRFSLLKNPLMRATAGRVANLRKASEIGEVGLDELLGAIRNEVARATSLSQAGSPKSSGGNGDAPDPEKVAELKRIILELHKGMAAEEAKVRFDEVIQNVSPREIGAMEEQLIKDGLPVQEIQRLCDLHVAMVRGSLDRQEELSAPPGHPVHTYRKENEIITGLANRLGELCSEMEAGKSGVTARGSTDSTSWASELRSLLQKLSGVENHYLRKENELFPVLERHGITGPSQVMWGVHDDIRGQLKAALELLNESAFQETANAGATLARAVIEMVYKEEKILLPLAQQTLGESEWAGIRRGEDELGYVLFRPEAPFPSPPRGGKPEKAHRTALPLVSPIPTAPLPESPGLAYVDLGTGRLSLEQVDMILRHLPIEISFVDADGFVRYYSETEDRLFPRTPGAIGRHVENCHPPKSVHLVKEILLKFRAGERDVAEFWIEIQGKFIHIRYFAVRNPVGEYLGCLEVTQDVTAIRSLEGQRRLLEWN